MQEKRERLLDNVALVGQISTDIVRIEGGKSYVRAGGTSNIRREFGYDMEIDIYPTTHCIVEIDICDGKKYGKLKHRENFPLHIGGWHDWTHIMYGDLVNNNIIKQCSESTNCLSIDFIHNKLKQISPQTIEKYVDVLFMSLEEDIGIRAIHTVLHSPNKVIGYKFNNKIYEFDLQPKQYKDVLGAGDIFAGAYIQKYLSGVYTLRDLAAHASKHATAYLDRMN